MLVLVRVSVSGFSVFCGWCGEGFGGANRMFLVTLRDLFYFDSNGE